MLGQNGSSRLDTVLKMLLIAFVSLLAFSSGVYFGKQMSDSEYQLKALEKDFNDNEKVASQEDKTEEATGAEQDKMIDDEVAQLSNKYMKGDADGDEAGARDVASVDDKKTTEKKVDTKSETNTEATKVEEKTGAKAQAKKQEAKAEQKPKKDPAKKEQKAQAQAPAKVGSNETAPIRKGKVDLTDVKKVAERVANNEVPTSDWKEDQPRKPASLPKISSGTAHAVAEYTVQVASYPDEKAAQTHAAELVKKGFPAYPLEANIKGKTWYRVSVGSFKTAKDAADYRSQLMKQANLSSAIVQKIDR